MLAGQKGLTMTFSYAASAPYNVVGDPRRIVQIVQNLVANALKFTNKGTVHIAVQGRAINNTAQLRISVEDSGPGIREEDKNGILAPFTKRQPSIGNEHTEVGGLGLAICKELVSLMDARIGEDSHVGEGTRIWEKLKMPLASTEAPTQTTDTAQLDGVWRQHKTGLLEGHPNLSLIHI